MVFFLAGQIVSPQSAPACVENKNDVSRENSTVDFSKVSMFNGGKWNFMINKQVF